LPWSRKRDAEVRGASPEMNIERSSELPPKLVQPAGKLHYGSPHDDGEQVTESEVGGAPGAESDGEIVRKMEELGYLDYGLDI
jgi:hypothetical protein